MDINTAARDELLGIPGIGSTRVKEIIEHRKQSDGFRSLSELDSLPSFQEVTPSEREALREWLEVRPETRPSGAKPSRIDLNSASRDDLLRIKGIGEARVEDILRRRERGAFRSIEEIDSLPRFRQMMPEQRQAIKQRLKVH